MKLRLPEEMRDRIAELAKQNGRSMNAEIVRRLEWSLSLLGEPTAVEGPPPPQQPIAGALTWLITAEINQLAAAENVPFDEMFAKIVLAGLHKEAPQVLYLALLPGTSKEDMRAAMEASAGIVRPDAAVMLERFKGAPWAPEWMVQRLQQAGRADLIVDSADGKAVEVELKSTAPKRIRRPAPKKP